MYQDHFGLHDDPFALGPSLRFLFRSRAHAETMAHLGYGLEQGEDIVLITGAIGTGKTLALQNLLAKVSRLFRQVLINVTQVNFLEFLKLLLHELDESWPERADTADVLVRLKDKALAIRRGGQKILLVVDESQNLNAETLEGIRLLTNIGQPDDQVFQIVLSGQPALDELINRPELAQLRQRIRIHYRLEPLSAAETVEYVNHRLVVAGRQKSLFTPAALARIHALSGGIPRLVNHLAGHALLAAFVEKSRKIDVQHVAADDMPEVPVPQVTAPRVAAPEVVVPIQTLETVAAGRMEPELPSPEPPAPDLISQPASRQPSTRPAPPAPPARRRSLVKAAIWGVVLVLAAGGVWQLLGERTPDLTTRRQPTPPAAEILPVQPADQTTVDDGTSAAAAVPAYWLHVASFRDVDRAEHYRTILVSAGTQVQLREVILDNGEPWQRVLIGPYTDEAQATNVAGELESQGLITFHRSLVE